MFCLLECFLCRFTYLFLCYMEQCLDIEWMHQPRLYALEGIRRREFWNALKIVSGIQSNLWKLGIRNTSFSKYPWTVQKLKIRYKNDIKKRFWNPILIYFLLIEIEISYFTTNFVNSSNKILILSKK